MAARTLTLDELSRLKGQEIGVSDWQLVTQEAINKFADATGDHQWIHVDPERAKKESPFGGPIAHGYYTLSLAPALMEQIVAVEGIRMGINYGLNKLRYPGPVRIGKRVRLKAALNDVEEISNGAGVQVTIGLTFEVDGESKPGCVAEAVYRYYK
ncbi:MAG: MaoC family dehydratase [Candidatus Binatia bacterium]